MYIYSGLRVDGTDPKRWFIWTPSKGHLEVCAIYSETTICFFVEVLSASPDCLLLRARCDTPKQQTPEVPPAY